MTVRNALALLLAGILVALVLFAPDTDRSRLIQELHNGAHGPIFGCIALLALHWLRSRAGAQRASLTWQYSSALAIAVALGAATELIQILVDRDASLLDLRNDALGAAAFLGLFAGCDSNGRDLRGVVRYSLAAIGAGTLIFLALPSMVAATEQVRREARFPVLADFSARFDEYYLEPQWATLQHSPMPAQWRTTPNETALHLRFESGPWPGLALIEPSRDWERYSSLLLDLTNPTNASLRFVVRIHDVHHNNAHEDRFNGIYEVAPSSRMALRISLDEVRSAPQGRAMDMKNIAALIIFRVEPSDAEAMYVSRIWLD